MPKQSLYRLTGEIPEIDIRRWKRGGHLLPGHRFIARWYFDNEEYAGMNVFIETAHLIRLAYRWTCNGKTEDITYPIAIDWTDCNFGGKRPWFICPDSDCGRRCAILYQGQQFLCRSCKNLRYPSQREPRYDRLARRAERIREHLCWQPGILRGPEPKPKHMHWKTFWRLYKEHERLTKESLMSATPVRKLRDLQ